MNFDTDVKYLEIAKEIEQRKHQEHLEKEKAHAQKRMETQRIQRMQIEGSYRSPIDPAANPESPGKQGISLMSVEELRINKGLLKEISKRKKNQI